VKSWKLDTWCTGIDEPPSAPSTSYTSSFPSIPTYSSPDPYHLTSAPPSSFPAPLTPIPEPSSWWYPSGSYPASSPYTPTGSPTGVPQPSSSATYWPPPPSSGPASPLPTSSGVTPIPLPRPTSISIPLPLPPPPPPASSSSSAFVSIYKRHAGRIQ
jgi:hypothetical protein